MGITSRETVQQIAALLVARSAKLAVAESVTAGRIQSLIATISGASDFFEGGVVVYSLDQKVRLLGVEPEHALEVNCVSAQVSQQMAEGVSRLFRTAFALSITGYAEPAEALGIEVPQAHVAVWRAGDDAGPSRAGGELLSHELFCVEAGRRKAQSHLANKALSHLLATLETME
jgi:PncC family amidohydrolase